MGVYSTLTVSSKAAKRFVLNKLMTDDITDAELTWMVDALLENSLYNVVIVPDDIGPDDDSLR